MSLFCRPAIERYGEHMTPQVNIKEAKTHFSRLVRAIESGAQREIIITRYGKPVAKLIPVEEKPSKPK
jgi:prevent-host-death family protein